MRLLLDTHIFLWFLSGDRQLSASSRALIIDPHNDVFLSVVSVWETAIKHQLGKLPLPEPPGIFMPRERHAQRIETLLVDEATIQFLPTLPNFHRDPFDRILICQALQHGLTLVTVDAAFAAYPVPLAR